MFVYIVTKQKIYLVRIFTREVNTTSGDENKMAKVLTNIPAIKAFTLDKSSTTNLAKKWQIWKEDFNLFVVASGITNAEQKKALLLHMAGKEVREVYRTLQPDENDKLENVIEKLDGYFKEKKNLSYERYIFKKTTQRAEEDTITYITRLRTLSESCEYTDNDAEIRDHFIATCRSIKLRKKLLAEQKLNLDNLIKIARNEETSQKQASEMEHSKPANETINKMHTIPKSKSGTKKENDKKFREKNNCFKCGELFTRGHLDICKAN